MFAKKLEECKRELIEKAIRLYGVGNVEPCTHRNTNTPFSQEDGVLIYWFNDRRTKTTRVVQMKLPKEDQ